MTALGDHQRRWIRVCCNHLTTVPVESLVTGEQLARLCTDCDAQLPPLPAWDRALARWEELNSQLDMLDRRIKGLLAYPYTKPEHLQVLRDKRLMVWQELKILTEEMN